MEKKKILPQKSLHKKAFYFYFMPLRSVHTERFVYDILYNMLLRSALFSLPLFICLCILTATVGFLGTYAIAQESGAASTSETVSADPVVDAYRAKLQKQLEELESQIEGQEKVLSQKRSENISLERDVSILSAQIAKAQLTIKARNIAISNINTHIDSNQAAVSNLNSRLQRELDSLGAILREKHHIESAPLVVVALSSKSLSQFFKDISSFDAINASVQESFLRIKDTKVATLSAQELLEHKREQEAALLQVQELERKGIQSKQSEKKTVLSETKGQEKAYQALITENRKSAAQIRAALFQLNGSSAIPFGKAVELANLASQKTGVRPAFLLGIIAEESNLGENVGTGTYVVDMHPTRDVPVFKAITAHLGLNPDSMPVSKKAWYGWGGAMGPAQFIPSTWAMYAGYSKPDWTYDPAKDRIGPLTGSKIPNPWDPKDAFMASALYLTDNGADTQTKSSEFHAAMCYLAGCGNAKNKSLAFYGNDVADLADKYQAQIDILNGR